MPGKIISLTAVAMLVATFTIAQSATPYQLRLKKSDDTKSNPVANLPFENIGPTIFSGRVSDIEVNPEDPTKFYVAYASGGLWYTDNNGTSFDPIFDYEDVMTIGDFDVDWENGTIWVGTGEVNSSRSSYAGLGMYVSRDEGKSWEHKGLEESHHIGKVLIHPTNKDNILVSALGHLYSPNPERGVYLSTDGGNSWTQTLFVHDNCGAVDMIRDPNNADILYSATWHRERRAWNFVESGKGSGIHKSIDGGLTWTKLTNGFPDNDGVGRIGLSIATVGNQTKIYALLDNYNRREKEEKKDDKLVKDDFKKMDIDAFNKLEDDQLKDYLSSNRFPKKYDVKAVKKLMKDGEITPMDLASYLEDANSLLFDTPVIGAEVYASDDGGESWYKTNEDYLDRVYNSYGYYFGVVRVNPSDLDEVYICGVPIMRSADGGKNFTYAGGDNVHSDHQALWINPNRDGHIINGNDGGINISYDDGEHWIKCNSPSVGQFYHIAVDMAEPYNVYGGLQDNGVWMGPHTYQEGTRWHSTGRYPYKSIVGGDGMQTVIDTRDNTTVYSGLQFGNSYRLNTKSGKRKSIKPSHDLGNNPYRWNWQSPKHLSIHNEDIVYFGANKLFRSFKQGEDMEAISDDLTYGGKKGDVPFGTLASIHESPLKFGLIYTGSDDGLVYLTKTGGFEWTNITAGLPDSLWVSRVQASAHKESRVYVSLNGYRNDDFSPFVYASEDYGATWQQLGLELPHDPVNVIKEDPENENLLYVGTDYGSYVSFDRGVNFHKFGGEMPHAPVHDLVIHPREHHLLVGTHGRSIYKADINVLRKYNEVKDEAIYFTANEKIKHNSRAGNLGFRGDTISFATDLTVYADAAGQAQIQTKTKEGKLVQTQNVNLEEGFSVVEFDLTAHEKQLKAFEEKPEEAKDGQYYLPKGEYEIVMQKMGKTVSHMVVIE